MITLKNNFHNTEVQVRTTEGKVLTKNQLRRIEKTLCGISECTCGIVRDDEYRLEPVGNGWGIVRRY